MGNSNVNRKVTYVRMTTQSLNTNTNTTNANNKTHITATKGSQFQYPTNNNHKTTASPIQVNLNNYHDHTRSGSTENIFRSQRKSQTNSTNLQQFSINLEPTKEGIEEETFNNNGYDVKQSELHSVQDIDSNKINNNYDPSRNIQSTSSNTNYSISTTMPINRNVNKYRNVKSESNVYSTSILSVNSNDSGNMTDSRF